MSQIVPFLCTKMATRAKNRNTLQMTPPLQPLSGFQTKLIGLFLGGLLPELSNPPLCCTKRLQELKIEKKTSNDITAVTTGQISTKLDRIVPWEISYQNCSNLSVPLHKMVPELKKKKKEKNSNISSVSTWRISTELDRIVLWDVLYQIAQTVPLRCTKWRPELK